MNEIKCPYWIVKNEQEWDEVIKKIGKAPDGRIHDFPMIIGKEPTFVFQCAVSNHPIKDYESEKENKRYVYELQEDVEVSSA